MELKTVPVLRELWNNWGDRQVDQQFQNSVLDAILGVHRKYRGNVQRTSRGKIKTRDPIEKWTEDVVSIS